MPRDAMKSCALLPLLLHQRLAILALREKRLASRIRLSYWVETDYMLANALTKHDANDACLWNLLTKGWWQIDGQLRIRATVRVANFEEHDLYDMGKGRPAHTKNPTADEMLVYHSDQRSDSGTQFPQSSLLAMD